MNNSTVNTIIKKLKSNYHNFHDYILSKKNNVTKLLYNKSFDSLSEIELLMMEFRVVNYISTHNLEGYSRKIRDEKD